MISEPNRIEKDAIRLPQADDGRLRILYLYQMLEKDSDENHMLSTPTILRRMEEEHGITMHRTTLPKDLELLREAGIETASERRRALCYYLVSRSLSMQDLWLLIRAVLSADWMPTRRKRYLITKLLNLTSKGNADKLKQMMKSAYHQKQRNT